MKRIVITSLAVGLAVASCKTADKTSSAKPGQQQGTPGGAVWSLKGFIPPTEIVKPAQLAEISRNDIEKRINALTSVIYNFGPDSADTSNTCLATILAGSTVQASKDKISADYANNDMTACFNTLLSGASTSGMTVRVNQARVRLMLRGMCEGGDASPFNGKTLRDISDRKLLAQFCQIGDRFHGLINTEVALNITLTNATGSIAYDSRSISGMMDANGDACVVTRKNADWQYEPCRKFEITMVTNVRPTPANQVVPPTLGLSDYYVADFANLTGENRGRYFTGGVISLELNNWKGQVKYSGADFPPTWSMTNAQNVAASGTFLPFTTATLRLDRLITSASPEPKELLPRFTHIWF